MDNRRKTIVINEKFQYQYSLLVVAVAVMLVNAFLLVRMLFPGDDPLLLSAASGIAIGVGEVLLIGAIWYGCLRATHRIAGPLFVINREVQRLGGGDLTARIKLRDTDMFRIEADEMNRSFEALRDRVALVQALAAELQAAQAAGGDIEVPLGQLRTALDGFTTRRGN